jgi:hypothetical protein
VTERPLFIDPITVGEGADVDDEAPPRWFVALALVLLVAAGYYVGSFWSGPRASSPHDFDSGRAVYERVRAPEAAESPGPAS